MTTDRIKVLESELATVTEAMTKTRQHNYQLREERWDLINALRDIDRSNDDMKYFNSDVHVIIHQALDKFLSQEISEPGNME